MPLREKFSKKSNLAFSSRNRKWEGIGSNGEEEEDAPEWIEFQDRVDLRLGAITQLTEKGERERKRGRQLDEYQTTDISKYVELKERMHDNAWTCDMQI